MSKLWIAIVFIFILLITGCKSTLEQLKNKMHITSITTTDSTVVVDGIALKYHGSTTLTSTVKAGKLVVKESNVEVNLTGNQTDKMSLTVSYMEYSPHDATIELKDGEITTITKSGKPMLITKVEGSLPSETQMEIKSGSGDITVTGLHGHGTVTLSTGSGNITVNALQLTAPLGVSTGSGNLSLDNCIAASASADTGSGNIAINKSKIDTMVASTGSGNIVIHSSVVNKKDFSTGSGQVIEN